MAHAVRGSSLLLVYSGGFSAIRHICHFNATVRRFNVWGYPSLYRRHPACPVSVVYGLMAWRCPLLRGLPLALPACRRPCSPVALSGGASCSAGAVSGVSGGCFAVRGFPPKSPAKSPGKSRKSLAKSLIFPKNHSRLQNSVYKGGIFLAHFPRFNGKSCKSRSISAHFASKSLASMYFCWSCSGVKPSICGWFGVKTISCLSTMP